MSKSHVSPASKLPAIASAWAPGRLETLERALGGDAVIEAGPIGLVVYGATPALVTRTARACERAVRARDPRVEVEHVGSDENEPPETRYYAVVTFDWERVGELAA